jgi:hypothetical protein
VSYRLIDGAAYYVVPRIPRWVVLLLVCVVGWYGGFVRLAPVLLREWGALLWYKRVLDGYKRSPRLLIYSFFFSAKHTAHRRRRATELRPQIIKFTRRPLSVALAAWHCFRERKAVNVSCWARVGRRPGQQSPAIGPNSHRRVAGKTGSL